MKNLPQRNNVIRIYCDGSVNPERSGAGAIVLNESGAVVLLANRILPLMSSNEAEYYGLMLGLELALKLEAQVVEARMDNEVVVKQMAGHFAVNSPRLKTVHRTACDLSRRFARISFVHVHRTENALADTLAAEASAGREWRLA